MEIFEKLPLRQQIYIDWLAGGNTLIDPEGKFETVTGDQLAQRLGVSRQGMHKWRKIDGFWDHVADRRRVLYGRERMSMVYKAMMGKALKGDTAAMKLMMQQARMLEAERTDVNVSGVIGVAVINYGTGEQKELPAAEKPQVDKVPVPEYRASPGAKWGGDTAKATQQQEGIPVSLEPGKTPVRFKAETLPLSERGNADGR